MINTKGLLSEKIYMHTKIYQQFHKLQGSARDSNYLEESNLFAQLGSDLHQLVGSSWMWRLGGGVDRREHSWNQGVGFKFLHSTLFMLWSRPMNVISGASHELFATIPQYYICRNWKSALNNLG